MSNDKRLLHRRQKNTLKNLRPNFRTCSHPDDKIKRVVWSDSWSWAEGHWSKDEWRCTRCSGIITLVGGPGESVEGVEHRAGVDRRVADEDMDNGQD